MNSKNLYVMWNGEMRRFEELAMLRASMPAGPERESLKAILYHYAYDYKAGPETLVKTLLQLEKGNKMNNPAGQLAKKPKVVMFRDWILGDRTYPTTDQTVSISGDDFTILTSHYKKFQTLVPYFQRQEAKAKAKIADEQEKLQEKHRYTQANGLDSVAFGHLSLSFPQWKQKGRFVKQGEKSKVYTMDGTGTDYALFSFAQTDVAENRYTTIKPRWENNQPCTCLGVCEDKR